MKCPRNLHTTYICVAYHTIFFLNLVYVDLNSFYCGEIEVKTTYILRENNFFWLINEQKKGFTWG